MTAAPPIAIPAIAPPERAGFDSAAAAVGVGVDVVVGVVVVAAGAVLDGADEEVDVGAAEDDFEDALSIGKDSPGLKSIVAFFAYAF